MSAEAAVLPETMEVPNVTKPKKRIGSIDICKGIAMLYVIAVHLLSGGMVLMSFIGFMLYFYYAISTYFYKPNRGIWFNIKKRIKQILVPLVGYTVVLSILTDLYMKIRGYGQTGIRNILTMIWGVLKGPRSFQDLAHPFSGNMADMMLSPASSVFMAYYFLELLFIGSVIFYFVADFALKKFSRMTWVSLVLIGASCLITALRHTTWFWNADAGFAVAGMMLWGAYAGKMKLANKLADDWKKAKYWGPALGSLAIYLIFNFVLKQNQYTLGQTMVWYSSLTIAILTISGGYVFLYVAALLEKIPGLNPTLQFIGRNSLNFMMMHMFFADLIADLTGWQIGMGGGCDPAKIKAQFAQMMPAGSKLGEAGSTAGGPPAMAMNLHTTWQQWVTFLIVLVLCALYSVIVTKIKANRAKKKAEKKAAA